MDRRYVDSCFVEQDDQQNCDRCGERFDGGGKTCPMCGARSVKVHSQPVPPNRAAFETRAVWPLATGLGLFWLLYGYSSLHTFSIVTGAVATLVGLTGWILFPTRKTKQSVDIDLD